ncbi:MAG: hypothetical protein KDK40_04410 [Chlamydiia bacterium]|nr:hypothetical protein [Chlamydiia bacterium]
MSKLSKQKVKKPKAQSTKAGEQPRAQLYWLPPFLVGLCCGILLHFVPGMDHLFQEASQSFKGPSQREAMIWRYDNQTK